MEDPWQGLTILNKPQTTLYLRESKFIFDFNSTDFWNKRWNGTQMQMNVVKMNVLKMLLTFLLFARLLS